MDLACRCRKRDRAGPGAHPSKRRAAGAAAESLDMQTRLARAIYRDHLYCLAAIAVVLGLQLSAAL